MVDVLAWTLPFRYYQEIIESAVKTTVRLKYKPVFVLKCQYLSSWFLFFSESLKSIKEYPCLYSVFTYILIRDNYHALLTPRLNSSNRYFRADVMSSSLNLLLELRSRIKRGGDPAFAVTATRLWNNLLLNIHTEKSLQSFKLCLKTPLLCSQPCCF